MTIRASGDDSGEWWVSVNGLGGGVGDRCNRDNDGDWWGLR